LNTIGYLPGYNQTYANVVGGLAGASSIYGAINQYQGNRNLGLTQTLTGGGSSFSGGISPWLFP
jgi:hypothetical protein